jgi:hypothetical protein
VGGVPEICRFLGVVVFMNRDDHPPPHFHVRYGGYEAQVVIATGRPLKGRLPPRVARIVREWATQHRDALMEDWQLASERQELKRIPPPV